MREADTGRWPSSKVKCGALALLALLSIGVPLSACGSDSATEDTVRADAGGAQTRSPGGSPGSASAKQILERGAARAAAGPDDARPSGTVRFRHLEHRAVVYNLGSAQPFTLLGTVTRTVTLRKGAAARIAEIESPLSFPSASARAAWQRAGKPSVPTRHARRRTFTIARDEFSFTPKGEPLTLRGVRMLRGSDAAIVTDVDGHSDKDDTLHKARQYAFLLGSAPLRPAARAALLRALAALPGLRRCGSGTDLAGRRGRTVCIGDALTDYILLLDARATSVLSIDERILSANELYPTLDTGTTVQRDTFVTRARDT